MLTFMSFLPTLYSCTQLLMLMLWRLLLCMFGQVQLLPPAHSHFEAPMKQWQGRESRKEAELQWLDSHGKHVNIQPSLQPYMPIVAQVYDICLSCLWLD
jgi:hypothetical protein